MISLAVTRTTPLSSAASDDAERERAAAAAAIASPCGASAIAAGVGVRPRGDMTPDRRLGEAQSSRRAGKTAVPHHLEEGAQFVPRRLALGHTKMYS